MFLIPFLLFGVPFALCLALSWHPALGQFRTSMLNPMLLLAGYCLLVAGDFASMAATGYGLIAYHRVSATNFALLGLEAQYVVMLLTTIAGIAFAFQITRFNERMFQVRTERDQSDIRVFALVAYVVIFVTWLLLLLRFANGGLSLQGAAELKINSSWDASLFIFSLALLPALNYLLPRQSFKVVVPLIVISIALLLFSGSRTRIAYVLIPFVFYLVRVRRWKLPRPFFAIGVVVAGFLALIAVNYRIITSSGQQATFAQLAETSNIFNQNDLSFAETNVALSRIPRRAMEDYPGQNLVGFVFAAVPRSVVPFKPLTGSNQFTTVFDPVNWRLYKRGLTIGAISELEFDFPFPLGAIFSFLFGAAWGWGFSRACRSKTIHGFAWTISLYVMLYAFLKSDIQSAAQLLWITAAYWLFVKAYQSIRRPVRSRRDNPAMQAALWRRKAMPVTVGNPA